MHVSRHEALVPDQGNSIDWVHGLRERRRAVAGQVRLGLVNLFRFFCLLLAGVKRLFVQWIAVIVLVVWVEPLVLCNYEACGLG